jgi:hypothetical protein
MRFECEWNCYMMHKTHLHTCVPCIKYFLLFYATFNYIFKNVMMVLEVSRKDQILLASQTSNITKFQKN